MGFESGTPKTIAEGQSGDVHFYGGIPNTADAVAGLLKKLGNRYGKLHVFYEAGPCGYGLYRQINAAGHVCDETFHGAQDESAAFRRRCARFGEMKTMGSADQ